jgi:HPt (histidine-containing phosphotransfer) domain-containing protein
MLESTHFVRIIQWERYSIESYLLDVNLLFPIIQSHAEMKVDSKGVLLNLLRDLAMEQLNDEVIRRVYEELEPENCELRNKDIIGKSFEDCASMLFNKIDSVRQSIKDLERNSWTTNFSARCQNLEKELRADWETNWKARCNSKRLFKDLQKRQKLKVSVAFMKSTIMKEMRLNTTEDWKLMKSLLSQAIDRAESIN